MRVVSSRGWRPAVAGFVAAVLAASCGGGGGENPPAPETLRVVLRDGDTLPGGFLISTIESANMSADQRIAVIASEPGSEPGAPGQNGVFVISPSGDVTTVMSPASPPEGLSLTTVRNLIMAPTGEVTFEVGDQLDDDGVFYYDGELKTVARTEPGTTPPGFKILGEIRLADGGLVAFTDGIAPCEADNSSGNLRVECTLRIHTGVPGQFTQVAVPNGLDGQAPTAIILQVNRNQEVAVGLPASGSEPLVGIIRGGQFQGLLNRRQTFEGLGTLLSARPRAIGSNGSVAIDAGFDTDGDGQRDRNRLLLYANDTIISIAESGVPASGHDGRVVLDVRGLDIDDAGRVIYSIEVGDPGSTTGFLSLRVWDGTSSQEIAFEGLRFGRDDMDEPLRILEIEQIRASRSGDVVFTGTIGRFDDEGTRRIDRTAIVRYADGQLEEVIQTKSTLVNGGRITSLSIQDINERGDLLVIGSIDRQANRALLMLPRL
jgi:hypothetical protein